MPGNRIMKAIIQSYRRGAFVYINPPLTSDSLVAKRVVRMFGPINVAENQNSETLYGYNNETERLRVIQFVTKQVNLPKKDKKKYQPTSISKERQNEIERRIVASYKSGSQFIVALPPVGNHDDAINALAPFGGAPVPGRSVDGRQQLSIDDYDTQIRAVVTIGYPNV